MSDKKTIDEILEKLVYKTANDFGGTYEEDEDLGWLKSATQDIKALITESEIQTRIDEVEAMAILAVDIEGLLPLLSRRIDQLKENK